MVGFVGGDKLKAHLAGLAEKLGEGKVLRVGFLEGETYPDGTNVAQVAFWNEYGTIKSPPRPFFRQMIAAKSPGWGAALGKNLIATSYNADAALKRVGGGIKDQLTKSIVDFSSPNNAESTIAKKGFDNPLIDSGQMQRAVDFDIKE